MKILVTGSSGFIGGHLVRELRNVGHIVTGMDIKNGPGHNACDVRNLDTFFSEAKPDVVVHLAAQVGRLFGEDDVVQTVRDNAGMTAAVSQVAGEYGARMVYASTSEVYGDNGETYCDEIEGPWTLPHNLYGLSKLWGEEVCKLYTPKKFTALRFSMPFGPGLPAGRGRAAIINLLWQAKHGMPMTVHRGAERSWCWIGDTVRGARMAIEDGHGPFNIGRSDNAMTMEQVAWLACDLTGGDRGLIELVDAPARQTVVKRLSMKRIKSLGWKPEVEVEEGMRRTLETWVDFLDENGDYVAPENEPEMAAA